MERARERESATYCLNVEASEAQSIDRAVVAVVPDVKRVVVGVRVLELLEVLSHVLGSRQQRLARVAELGQLSFELVKVQPIPTSDRSIDHHTVGAM